MEISPEQLEELKAQIKLEVLKEMSQESEQVVDKTPSKVLNAGISDRLSHIPNYYRSRIEGALSALVRYALGIKTLARLKDDDLEKAEYIAHSILDLLLDNKKEVVVKKKS